MITELLACIAEIGDTSLPAPSGSEQEQRLMEAIPGACVAELLAGIAEFTGLLEVVRDQVGVHLGAEQERRGLAQTGEPTGLGKRPRSGEPIPGNQMELGLLNL